MPISDSAPAVLELQKLCTGYGDVPVVQDCDVRFAAGRMTAVIGSNGAGKSTLIKAAAGLLRVWSGKVLANGRMVRSRRISPRGHAHHGPWRLPLLHPARVPTTRPNRQRCRG